ncbi:MAG: hypothetical protein AAFO69_11335 [Bacteroidota bacterium]
MKRQLLFASLLTLISVALNAQERAPLSQGSWLIEANTGTLATGNTAFSLLSTNGVTQWSIGGETGYFVKDNLALKVGLGYSDVSGIQSSGTLVYKFGAKYYINGNVPLGADLTGITSDGSGVSWFGLQSGYAWFVGSNVSIEPTIRYNISLDGFTADSNFQGLIGFVIHI